MFFVIVFNCFSPQIQCYSKHHVESLSKMISKFSISSQHFKVNQSKIPISKISIGISTCSNLASWEKRHTHAWTYVCNYVLHNFFRYSQSKTNSNSQLLIKDAFLDCYQSFSIFWEILLRNWILFYLQIGCTYSYNTI